MWEKTEKGMGWEEEGEKNRTARGQEGEVHFAWFHSVGDFNYFSETPPRLVMSCMLWSPASDCWAGARASARCQAIITFALESASARQKAYKAIIPVLSFIKGLSCMSQQKVKADSCTHSLNLRQQLFLWDYLCFTVFSSGDSWQVRFQGWLANKTVK